MQMKLFSFSLLFVISYILSSLLKCYTTAGGVASVGERVTFSSPDENARAGEIAPKSQYQPTLATRLVSSCIYLSFIENVKVVPLPNTELT